MTQPGERLARELERRARELLAAEYEREGGPEDMVAVMLRDGNPVVLQMSRFALAAISRALSTERAAVVAWLETKANKLDDGESWKWAALDIAKSIKAIT